jgi:YbbR domain-containing protein
MPKSKFLETLTFNWPGKVLSLAAAILLYLIIGMVTVSSRSFTVPLEVDIPAGYRVESTVAEAVVLTLTGPEEQIYRVIPEQLRAYADFSGIDGEGTYEKRVLIDTGDSFDTRGTITIVPDPSSVKLYLSPAGGSEAL